MEKRLEKKIRVLVTAHSFIEKSGVENYLQNLFEFLSGFSTNIEYIFIVNKYSKNYYKFKSKNIYIYYPSKLLDFQIGKILWYIFFVPRFLRKNKISLIFNSRASNTFIPIKKIPIISCVHDLAEYFIKDKYTLLRMFYRKYICLPLNKVYTKYFICVSNSTKYDLIKFLNINENIIFVIHNGIEHIQKPKNFEINKINKINYLLYVGRLDPYGKNLLRLLEAFNEIRNYFDIKLLLVGNNSRGSSKLYKFVKDNFLEDKVKFMGYVEEEKLIEIYSNAYIFIFPSLYEGFGFPVLEAMTFGLPVICSNTSSLPEIAGDAALYFNPNNINDIKNSIVKLLNDHLLIERLISKGLERIKLFSWNDSAKKTLEVINKLVMNNEK